jgi:hypothetical protein
LRDRKNQENEVNEQRDKNAYTKPTLKKRERLADVTESPFAVTSGAVPGGPTPTPTD